MPAAGAIRHRLNIDVIDKAGNNESTKQDDENANLYDSLKSSNLADLVAAAMRTSSAGWRGMNLRRLRHLLNRPNRS